MKLQPYEEYRESGQAWLGKIPSHWETRRIKYILREKDLRSTSGKEQLLRVSQYTGVTQRIRKDGLDGADTRAESLIGYKKVQPDDLVINIMLAWNGSLGVSRFSGIASPAYCVYRFGPDINPWYFHHLSRSPTYKARIKAVSTGVVESRLRLYSDDLYRIEALLPPPEEQTAIVRFLDDANRQIEKAIRAKRKLIALLNEQKQAIIHRAVTRGLDPDVALKDSGIPWIGQIPAHWQIIRLGKLINLITGFPFASAQFSENQDDTRLLRGINVTPAGIRWESVVYWKNSSADSLGGFLLREGDIVLGMDRPIVSAGIRAAIIESKDTPSLLLQRVARLRPSEQLNKEFLLLLLQGRIFKTYIAPIFTGISVPHLSPEQIKGFKIVVPPVSEQEAISARVKLETSELSNIIAKTEHEISLLREYRTRLTADIVTGKLDVREAARQLPEEIGEPDQSDMADDETALEDLEFESADDMETEA